MIAVIAMETKLEPNYAFVENHETSLKPKP